MPLDKPVRLLAKHITSCTVAFSSPVAGTLTFSTPLEMAQAASGTGTFDSFIYTPRKDLVDVTNADALVMMRQDQRIDFSATLREVAPANNPGNLALGASQGGSHARIIVRFKMPGDTVVSCIAVIGIIETAPKGIQTGKNTDELTIQADYFAPYGGLVTGLPSMFTS